MELKRIKEEINRLETYKSDDSITESGLELLAELKHTIELVKNNAVLPLVSGSAFIAKADRENILVLVDDKYKVFNKLREIGKTWKSISIEPIDKVV